MQKLSLTIKPQIKNNYTSVIKVTNKQPFLKHSISDNSINNVKDQFIIKETAHPRMQLFQYPPLMIDGVN